MKLLKTINFENVSEDEKKKFKIRNSVRAVIFDNKNKIGIMHVVKGGFYKLPGGGIEGEENNEEALKRECLEEAGVNIEIILELGEIVEIKKEHQMIQNSFCYIAKVVGEKGNQQLTEKESEEGFKIEWIELSGAIKKIEEGGYSFGHGRYVYERERTILEKMKKIISVKNR